MSDHSLSMTLEECLVLKSNFYKWFFFILLCMSEYMKVTKGHFLDLRIKCTVANEEIRKFFNNNFRELILDDKWYREAPIDSELPRRYRELYLEVYQRLEEYRVR